MIGAASNHDLSIRSEAAVRIEKENRAKPRNSQQPIDLVEKMWGGMNGKILTILPAVVTHSIEGPLVADGEFTVVPKIVELLTTWYQTDAQEPMLTSAVDSLCPDEKWRNHNLVLLGGPVTNPYTRLVLREINTQCKFVGHEHKLQVPGIGEVEAKFARFKPKHAICYITRKNQVMKKRAGYFVEKDWGLFLRAKSPFAADKRVYIFAGCQTYGTAAAACAAMSPELIQSLLPGEVNSEMPNEAVIKVTREIATHVRAALQVVFPVESFVVKNPASFTSMELCIALKSSEMPTVPITSKQHADIEKLFKEFERSARNFFEP